MAWPEEVDVLEASDIYRGIGEVNEKHCAYIWLMRWFPDNREWIKAVALLRTFLGTKSVIGWNDKTAKSKAEIASTLNKVTAGLGYKVNNPEAKNV